MPYPVAAIRGRSSRSAAAAWWQPTGINTANILFAYQPKGAASLAASYVDLGPNGNDAAPGNAPSFDTAVGWTFDGAADYLDTGVIPDNDQTATLFVAVTNASGALSCPSGVYESESVRFGFYIGNGGGSQQYMAGGILLIAGALTGTHVIGIVGNKSWLDGAAQAGTITTGSGSATQTLYIGAVNNGGSAAHLYTGNIVAAWYANVTLTDDQAAQLSTSMAAL